MTQIVHAYDNIDNSHYTKAQQSAAMMMNVDSSGTITNPQFFKNMNEKTINGYSKTDDLKINQLIKEIESEYQKYNESIAEMHTMQNMHKYITTNTDTEKNKMLNLLNTSKNTLQKSKQESIGEKNAAAVYMYYIKIMLVTLFFFAICFIIYMSIKLYKIEMSNNYIMTLIGTIISVYLLLIVLYYRDTINRRKDDFEKRLFKPPPVKNL